MKIMIFWICSWVLFSQEDEPLVPADFAYGSKIELSGGGAIFAFAVPEFVYKSVLNPELTDVRVFGGNDRPVPHSLRRFEQPAKDRRADEALPFFPLYEKWSEPNARSSMQIVTNHRGTVVHIQHSEGTLNRNVQSYLIDCSGLLQQPEALVVTWMNHAGSFVATVSVLISSDLTHWTTLIAETGLSNLQYSGNELIQRQIDLPIHKAKYLRIDVPSAIPPFTKFVARFPEFIEESPRLSAAVKAGSFDARTQTYSFDLQGFFPVDRLRVLLPQRNTLVRVRIEATNDTLGAWSPAYSGLLYDLLFGETRLQQQPLHLRVTTFRYWRMTILEKESTLGEGMPELQFFYLPHQLLFVAQGEGPFKLAFASARAKAAITPLETLLSGTMDERSSLIKEASLEPPLPLGGPDALQIAKPVNWHTWTLWSVLVAGVLLLLSMALRLFRQINPS